MIQVDGELREMNFLTNNITRSAQTIADLDRCRWSIEVFFKKLKRALQLADFLATAIGRSNGRSGPTCWPMCCCGFALTWAGERTASPACFLDPFCPLAKLGTAQPAGSLWDSPFACSSRMAQILSPLLHSTFGFSSIAASNNCRVRRYLLSVVFILGLSCGRRSAAVA